MLLSAGARQLSAPHRCGFVASWGDYSHTSSTPRTIELWTIRRSPSTRPTGHAVTALHIDTESCWRWAIPCAGGKRRKHPQLKDRIARPI